MMARTKSAKSSQIDLLERSSQPHMRELYRAALAARGSIEQMLRDLRISRLVMSQRLSILRSLGIAQLVTLHNPIARGAGQQSTAWVRLVDADAGDIARFEEALIADSHVAGAQRVIGDFDYRLSTFHRDWREAAQWARELRQRAKIDVVEMMNVQHLFGDDLPGLILRAPRRGGPQA
jgi:hypothetical protein